MVTNMVNVVGASSKRRDILHDKQFVVVSESLKHSELSSGQGLNQETTLKRACDTRWGLHYGTLLILINMFSYVIEVLGIIVDDGSNKEQRYEATNLLESMQSFNFIFSLHLMRTILGITNELSQALQRKDQDIVNVMTLVKVCKQQFQMMRDNGWSSLLDQVFYFCERHNIDISSKNDTFLTQGRPRRKAHEITILHHYQVELFYVVINMQLQELNSCFTEVNTKLLLCVACLNPCDSFIVFDKQKLLRLAQFYPQDFSPIELMILNNQLETYIIDMRSSSEFSELKGISYLFTKDG